MHQLTKYGYIFVIYESPLCQFNFLAVPNPNISCSVQFSVNQFMTKTSQLLLLMGVGVGVT